jgi:hypothetical protein
MIISELLLEQIGPACDSRLAFLHQEQEYILYQTFTVRNSMVIYWVNEYDLDVKKVM